MKPVTKNAARSLESGTSPPAPSILSSLSTSPNTKFHPKDLNHVRNGGHSRQSASALSTTTTRNKNSIYNAMEVQLKKQFPDLEENDVVLPATTTKPKKVPSPTRPKSPHSSKPQNFIEKNKKQIIKKTVKRTKDDSPPISPTSTIKQQRSSSGTSGQSSFNNTSRPHHQQQPSAGILKDTLKKKDFAATRRPPSPQNLSNSTSNHSKPTAHERSHVRAATPDSAVREENKALKRLLEQYMNLVEDKDSDIIELEEVVDTLRKYNSKLISELEALRACHKDHEANEFNNNNNDDNNGSNGSSPTLLIMSSIKQNHKRAYGDQVDNKVDDNKTLATPLEKSSSTTTVAKSPSASIIAAHTQQQPQPTLAKITTAKKFATNAAAAPVKSTTTTTKNATAPKTPVANPRGISLFNKLHSNAKPSASMATPLQSASSLKPEASHKTLIHGKRTADDLNVDMEDTTDDDDGCDDEFIYRNDPRFNLNNNATPKNVTSTTDISSEDDEHLDDSSDSDSSAVTNSSSDYSYSDSGEEDSEDDERPIEKFNKNNNEWGLNAASFKSDFVDEVTDTSNDEFEYEPPSPHQHYQNKYLNIDNLANSTTSHFNKLSNSSTSSSDATNASVVSTSTKSNSLATSSSNSSSDNKPKKRIGIRRQNALTSSNPLNKNKLNNNNNNNNNNNGQSVKKSSQNLNSTSKNNNNNGKNNNGLNQKQKSDPKFSKMASKSSTSTSPSSSLANSSFDYNQKSNQTHRDSLSNKSDSSSDDSSSSTSSSSTQNGSSSVTSPSTAYTTSSCNSIGKSFNDCIQSNLENSSNNSLLNSTYDSLTSSNNNGNNNNDSITSGQKFNSTHNSTTTSTTFTPSATSPKLVSSQIDNNSAINSGHFSSQNSSYVSTPTPSHNIINKNYNLVSSSRQNSSYVSTQQIKSDSINRVLSPVSSISASTNSVSSTTRVQSPISVSSSRVSTPSCESSYNRRNRYNNNNNSNSTASSVIPPPPPPPENKDTIATLQHFLRLISENSESNKDPKDFYDLKKVIDEGSSAQVFTAHALDTNEECAIKVVPLTYSLEFIFNEIFILKNLKHKNIVDFKESFVKWDGKTREVWLAMEKCARGDVTSRAGKVNQREVSRMARDLLEALKHLHHNGIIHRDIKLSNILGCANNDVKLADFGISSLTPTSTTAMVGTIPYMAPDVVLVGPDRPYDTKVDVWSLGVCILELLTGKAAWGRIRDDEIMDKLRRGEMPYGFQRLRKKADIGWEVVDFLEKCFAKNPENRWDAERLLEHPFITNCY